MGGGAVVGTRDTPFDFRKHSCSSDIPSPLLFFFFFKGCPLRVWPFFVFRDFCGKTANMLILPYKVCVVIYYVGMYV